MRDRKIFYAIIFYSKQVFGSIQLAHSSYPSRGLERRKGEATPGRQLLVIPSRGWLDGARWGVLLSTEKKDIAPFGRGGGGRALVLSQPRSHPAPIHSRDNILLLPRKKRVILF